MTNNILLASLAYMRWLHLSDLHVGNSGSNSQTTALQSLVKAIDSAIGPKPVDAIFFTGDLTYAGKAEQFQNLTDIVLSPLRKLTSCENAKIYVSPGNHDLDCDVSLPSPWESLGPQRQAIFFDESPEAAKLRSPRAQSFAAYSTFIKKEKLIGVDPLLNISELHRLQVCGRELGIVTTNTAFFCDKSFQDREKIPAPDASLRGLLGEAKCSGPIIILGHHPYVWFFPTNHNPLKSLLLNHRALYLHGHMHDLSVTFGPDGVESLGFGAAYQAPQGPRQSANYYKNSFAICELDSQLHVAPYHWDVDNGRWVSTTTLPSGFFQKSATLKDGWNFRLTDRIVHTLGSISATPKLTVPRLTPAGTLSYADWQHFLTYAQLLPVDVNSSNLSAKSGSAGEHFFEYELNFGRHLIRCIPAPGGSLTKTQIDGLNTALDTDALQSYTVISLGTMTAEAEETYLRLKLKKPIHIFTANDLAERLAAMGAFAAALGYPGVQSAEKEFALAAGGKPILIVQERLRKGWFFVVTADGKLLPESDERVVQLRQSRSELQDSVYSISAKTDDALSGSKATFDRVEYLNACRKEFVHVKYAALAAIGLRLPSLSLEELYVDTGAKVGGNASSAELIQRAIEDLLQGAAIEGVLREELVAQLEMRVKSEDDNAEGSENSSARVIYQQYNSIAILGDPGSGKTCFVKREILAYTSEKPESWYERHVPVHVPLAELASMIEAEEFPDILKAAARMAAKRGFPIKEEHLTELFGKGLLAVFFDGLDEVVSVEARSKIFSAVKQLIEKGSLLGNRFVITSRPAAIHQVELPKSIEIMHMRGLTDSEMRTLAEKILAARVSETKGSIRLDVTQLGLSEKSIIDQLILDCNKTPGLDRLARNPLLLTLLVMIYANSGAASARRHRVYQQAVNTLVSIRAREAGQRGLSEADLRRRLGTVALSVFRDQRGALPTLDRVIELIRSVMISERSGDVDREEVEKYVSDVAEATGLLVLHKKEDRLEGSATVTFMHHSFLEYYAALGLAATNYLPEISNLAKIPRWRDVLTLLAGICADASDVHPIVDTLLAIQDPEDGITFDSVLLAMDCALESDVPPERVLRALTSRIESALLSGPLRHDSFLREQVGRRLARLLSNSGSPLIERMLIRGLASNDGDICSGFLDLLGYVAAEADVSRKLVETFDQTCERSEAPVQISSCIAASRAAALRSGRAVETVKMNLKGGFSARIAALQAIVAAPSLGADSVEILASGIDDSRGEISEKSARALLRVGLPLGDGSKNNRDLLAKSLRRIAEGASSDVASDVALTFRRSEIEPFLSATEKANRILGIRLLAWVSGEELFVHDMLMRFIRGQDREEKSAALSSLRIAARAQKIVTNSEIAFICSLLEESQTRDVRLAAAWVLGALGYADSDTSRALIRYCRAAANTDQYRHVIGVLASFIREDEIVQAFLLDEAERLLTSKSKLTPEFIEDSNAALRLIDGLDVAASHRLIARCRDVVSDYRFDAKLRRRALYAYVSITPVEISIKYLREKLKSPPTLLGTAVVLACSKFAGRCRKRLEYIKLVYPELSFLQNDIIEHYRKYFSALGYDNVSLGSYSRAALNDIRHMLNSFREFSERKSSLIESSDQKELF